MEFNNGLYAVLPGADQGIIESVENNGEPVYYTGYQDKDKTMLIGYAFASYAKGYSSTIQTLVGIDTAGTIIGLKILFQKETPGLGTRVEEIRSGETEPWWQIQFNGKLASEVAVDKDGGEIQSITGATITSRAIADAIAAQASETIQLIQTQQE